MEGGVPPIGKGLNAHGARPVNKRTEREQDDAEGFVEALEELASEHGETPEPPTSPPHVELDVGYPTDDETGLSIDVKA